MLMDGIKKDLKGLAGVPNPFDFRAALSEVQEAGPTGSLADMVDDEVSMLDERQSVVTDTVRSSGSQVHDVSALPPILSPIGVRPHTIGDLPLYQFFRGSTMPDTVLKSKVLELGKPDFKNRNWKNFAID